MRSAPVKTLEPFPLEKLRPPEPGGKVLVAVSGGLDSMVLLHALKRLSAARRWKLAVVHFNHRLRGRASDADETFVRNIAAAMKLPFIASGADVKKIAKEQKLSIEMAARKSRHEFFAYAARKHQADTVALAHHADDQVELFFLRLLRGAAGGLAGMKWRSPSPSGGKVSLIRPLLNCSRSELEQYANENRIHYREDATNSSLDFLRNRIRHELLPLLRKHYQPGLNKTILRLMEISGADSDFLVETAQAWLHGHRENSPKKNSRIEPLNQIPSCNISNSLTTIPPLPGGEGRGEGELNKLTKISSVHGKGSGQIKNPCFQPPPDLQSDFEKLPIAIQRRVLKLEMAALGIAADFDLIETVRKSPNEQIAISRDYSIWRDEQGHVCRHERKRTTFDGDELAVRLDGSGQIVFGGVKFKWQIRKRSAFGKSGKIAAKSGSELFDAAKTGEKIILRHWRAGDRFQPIGFESPAKLQDLFTNAKIPRERRHKLIVAEADGEIFWVEGLRISENFKVTPRTRRFLFWSWQ